MRAFGEMNINPRDLKTYLIFYQNDLLNNDDEKDDDHNFVNDDDDDNENDKIMFVKLWHCTDMTVREQHWTILAMFSHRYICYISKLGFSFKR